MVTKSPGSSQGTPRSRGMSSSTPRPTTPSFATSMVSSAAPFEVTVAAGTPLYRVPSYMTWHSASMWLSALPCTLISRRSVANDRPLGLASSAVPVIG